MMKLQEKVAREERVQEQVRKKFNPGFDPSKSIAGTVTIGRDDSLRRWIKRRVESDRLTLQDKQVARDKGWIRG